MVSYCCFLLHFPVIYNVVGPFICSLYLLFGEMSVKVFGLFFSQVVCFVVEFEELFIYLDNNFSSDVFIINIFSQSMVCLLIDLILSFVVQFIILMKSRLSLNFFFHDSCLWCCI